MDELKNALDIVRLQEQVGGLRAQQSAHNAATQARFDSIQKTLDDLVASLNRGRGAYAASLLIAGAIGAVALSALKFLGVKIGG